MAQYSDETKAAVLAALLTGQSVSSVAKEYNIPKGTVSAWKSRQGVASFATQKRDDVIGELLTEYLQTSLRTLQAQAAAFSDPVWLKKQHASDAAVLHGVMTDKAVRLLEAFGASDDDDSDTNA